MCLILFAVQHHRDWPLVMAANRDEFHQRPTEVAHLWQEPPFLLAGKDLQEGGTWMGIYQKSLCIAALTNYRNPLLKKEKAPSRGQLVTSFLEHTGDPLDFLHALQKKAASYNGFNLLCGRKDSLYCYGSEGGPPEPVPPGPRP